MNAIELYNHATYSLSVGILASALVQSSRKRYIIATVLTFVVGVLIASVLDFTMLVFTILLTLVFAVGTKKYHQTYYLCLTAIFILWCVTAVVASVVMIIAPDWHGGQGFNIFIGLFLVAFSIVVKAKPATVAWCRDLEHVEYAILIELLIIFFFSFILTRYYTVIAAENKRQWGVFCLAFLLLLAVVGLCFNYMKNLERQHHELRVQQEQQIEFVKQAEEQYSVVIALKHYYGELVQSLMPFIHENDMEGVRRYFADYIIPIHNKQVIDSEQLDRIRNRLIQNLIVITEEKAIKLDGVAFDLSVTGKIDIPAEMEMEIFELLTIFCNNALDSLSQQKGGLLKMTFSSDDEGPSIVIGNTLHTDIDIDKLYCRFPNGRRKDRGYGLKRARAIVLNHRDIEHFTYKHRSCNGQSILCQQIKINRKEGGK